MPLSDDWEELIVVGSIDELKELTGCQDVITHNSSQSLGLIYMMCYPLQITDIHRQFIDGLTIPSRKGKGLLRRVDEVFDCWFESGSMPYAQIHYPFENKERFVPFLPFLPFSNNETI